MTKENQKKAELFSVLIHEYLEEQEELERKADRRYYRHNVSLEGMESANVSVEMNATKKSEEVLDELINNSENYGLIEMIENEELLSAMKKLKEIDLSILTLRYKKNLYLREIAAEMEKDIGTICRRLDSALAKIKESIESENE